jgi:hypothetical protein
VPDVRPSLRENLAKTINRVRARGPIELWELASSRVRDNVWSDDVLVVFSSGAGGEPPESEELHLAVAGAADAADYARDIGTDSEATFVSRLSDKSLCYLVRDGERILHSSWVSLHAAWTRELRGYVVPPSGDAYVYESFTREDARGRGVYPYALKGMRADLASKGVGRVWVAAEADNAASRRAIEKAGFEERYRLAYRRRFGTFRLLERGTGGTPDRLAVTRKLAGR